MAVQHRPKRIVLFEGEVDTASNFVVAHNFGKIRIAKIGAIFEEAQAAHSTITRTVLVGTAADTDRYADLTNDSDRTTDAVTDPDGVIVSSAWAALTAKELDFSAKTVGNAPGAAAPGTPGGSYPEHSGVLVCTVTHAGTTPTASRGTVYMDYFDSD